MKLLYIKHNIDENTWCLADSFGSYSYVVQGDEKALLVDTGLGIGNLMEEVRKLTQKPLVVINTHGHIDHIGSNYLFDQVYINYLDLPVAKEHSSKEFRTALLHGFINEMGVDFDVEQIDRLINMPNTCEYLSIEDGDVIDLGGRTISVVETPGHTHGSICLFDSKNNMLFSGDMICDKGVLLQFDHSETLEVFLNSMERIKGLCTPETKIYPGHHTIPIASDFVDDYIECAQKITADELEGFVNSSVLGESKIYIHKRIAISLPNTIYKK